MESLGKEQDLAGNTVHEGLTVYGNKGSTDQHAYVQQLREGLHNFFVTFVEVLRDREGASMEVEPGITSGDYLSGFLLGTREALTEKSRESITITLEAVTPQAIGAIIALFERAVGLYASLVNINAYHQPGVEAGKRAAGHVLALQNKLVAVMRASAGQSRTAGEWAEAADAGSQVEWVYKILRHLAANPDRGIVATGGPKPTEARFHFASEPQGASSPPGADRREGA
jgi:glucose-6-phosphate isomerase